MKVTILGTRASYPSADRQMVSLIVGHNGATLLVDAGSVRVFEELSRLATIGHIFISHSHHDHVAMLPHIVLMQSKVRKSTSKKNITSIYSPESLDTLMSSMELTRGVQYLHDTTVPNQVGPFRIDTLITAHPIPCYAYAFGTSEHRVVYTGDTTYFPELADFCADSDILLCEATYSDNELDDALHWGHMTPYFVAQLLQQSDPRYVVLLHFSSLTGEDFVYQTLLHLGTDFQDRIVAGHDYMSIELD